MAQDTTPSIIMYPGGTNTFPVPFDKGYYGEVKVLFVRRGATGYEHEPSSSNYVVNGRLYAWGAGSNYIYTHTPMPAVEASVYNDRDVDSGKKVEAIAGQTITVDGASYIRATQHDISNHLMLTWIGEELGIDDYICIGRDTERGQPYSLPNNQKHIEGALDNIERQVQELKDKTDNALVVDPTHTIDASKMGPIDWLGTIVRSTDKTARAIRYHNGYLQFSLEDPDVPLDQKTWTSVLNTINITTIREWYDEEKNEYHFLYSKNNGVTWKELPLYDAVHGFEKRLVSIENEQVVLGAGVKGNAEAIQKTRDDYIEADSEIHQILNDHASELTTLRGNQASLGDQVSGIEEKIPGDASATNQLATKADLANVDLDGYVKKSGDTMTGDLAFEDYSAAHPQKYVLHGDSSFSIKYYYNNEQYPRQSWNFAGSCFYASTTTGVKPFLGTSTFPWENIYAKKLNNGADITIPTLGGTLARIEDLIDLRADINEADSELQTQITAQAAEIATKQDQLTAGDNIIISNNVISATGAGGGAGFDIVVVQELPATGQKGIIYLLAKDGTAPDIYDEYVWITATQTFELIGTTQVDLTDYVKNTDYATSAKAGIIRPSEDLATNVNTYGYLRASFQTLEQYNSASDSSFIGKRTLENIKEDLVARAIENAVNTRNLTAGSAKFDTAPITDDNTTYASALDVSLMRKAQVATAIADAVSNIDALPDQTGNAGKVLTTDGSTASWQEPQGGGTKVIIKRYN